MLNLKISQTLYLILALVCIGLISLLIVAFVSITGLVKHADLVQNLNQNNIDLLLIQTKQSKIKQEIDQNSKKSIFENLKNTLKILKNDYKQITLTAPKKYKNKAKNLNQKAQVYFDNLEKVISIKLEIGSENEKYGSLNLLKEKDNEFIKKAGFLSSFVNQFEVIRSSGKSFILDKSDTTANKWSSEIKKLEDSLVQMGFEADFLPLLKDYEKEQKNIVKLQKQYSKIQILRNTAEHELIKDGTQYIELINKTLTKAKQESVSKNKSQSIVLVITSLVIILFIAGLIIFLTRNINQKAKNLLDGMEKISHGDLRNHLAVSGNKDEFSLIAISANKIVDSLKFLIGAMYDNNQTLQNSANNLQKNIVQMQKDAQVMVKHSNDMVGTIKSVTTTSNNAATTCQELENSSKNANEISTNGDKIISQTIESIKDSAKVIDDMNEKADVLEQRTKEIDKVIEIITNIADQIGMLALNAAIEAARVGPAGRGFAVVANEVNNLAEETAKATNEINVLVQAIKSDTHSMISGVGKAKNLIDKGDNLSTEALNAISDIKEGSNTTLTQSLNVKNALEEVTNNNSILEETTNNTNTLVLKQLNFSKTIYTIGEELRQSAKTLEDSINKFKT